MSKRFSLRDFQQGVLDRLNNQSTEESRINALGALIGKDYWLVDMSDISEVMPLPALTPVPMTQPWFCGVVNVRGNLYSITDLALFFGHEASPRNSSGRILLLNQKYALGAGILVTRVLGLRNPSHWTQIEQGEEIYLQDSSGQRWRKLDISGLLHRAEFLHIGV